MNSSYKHLETKLRVAELTVGQWAGVVAGVALAITWGLYLSPFGTNVTLCSAIYVGGTPVMLVLLGCQSDLDVWLWVGCRARWRHTSHLYLPGAGRAPRGYLISAPAPSARAVLSDVAPDLEFDALWD